MFSHHFRLLAFVPRWQIAPRFRTQNVAEHSYFVALYTTEIVNRYKWHWPLNMRLQAVECALYHDAVEARTGDMPGPVKRAVTDPDKLDAYEIEQAEIMGFEIPVYDEDVLAVVKVADLIDELFHVAMEISMGNSLIVRQYSVTLERFHAAVRRAALPLEMAAVVEEEVHSLRMGFQLPANKPETDPLTSDVENGYIEDLPF
jgi:5'-deoxynucleotidase